MEAEFKVLSYLQENEFTTQRIIARRTGLSLGAVNLLLKKMVRKGLIKIEHLNARSVRYILTTEGMREKSIFTYNYIRKSYNQILKINQALEQLVNGQEFLSERGTLFICGPNDEILEIILAFLRQKKIPFQIYQDPGSLTKLSNVQDRAVLVWRDEEEVILKDCLKMVNLLNII